MVRSRFTHFAQAAHHSHHPTAALIRRKFNALSLPALDTLVFMMDLTIAEKHGRGSVGIRSVAWHWLSDIFRTIPQQRSHMFTRVARSSQLQRSRRSGSSLVIYSKGRSFASSKGLLTGAAFCVAR